MNEHELPGVIGCHQATTEAHDHNPRFVACVCVCARSSVYARNQSGAQKNTLVNSNGIAQKYQ